MIKGLEMIINNSTQSMLIVDFMHTSIVLNEYILRIYKIYSTMKSHDDTDKINEIQFK